MVPVVLSRGMSTAWLLLLLLCSYVMCFTDAAAVGCHDDV